LELQTQLLNTKVTGDQENVYTAHSRNLINWNFRKADSFFLDITYNFKQKLDLINEQVILVYKNDLPCESKHLLVE